LERWEVAFALGDVAAGADPGEERLALVLGHRGEDAAPLGRGHRVHLALDGDALVVHDPQLLVVGRMTVQLGRRDLVAVLGVVPLAQQVAFASASQTAKPRAGLGVTDDAGSCGHASPPRLRAGCSPTPRVNSRAAAAAITPTGRWAETLDGGVRAADVSSRDMMRYKNIHLVQGAFLRR